MRRTRLVDSLQESRKSRAIPNKKKNEITISPSTSDFSFVL